MFERCFASLPLETVHRLHKAELGVGDSNSVLRETAHTYGEIKYDAFVRILRRVKARLRMQRPVFDDESEAAASERRAKFMDLGSGIGKVFASRFSPFP